MVIYKTSVKCRYTFDQYIEYFNKVIKSNLDNRVLDATQAQLQSSQWILFNVMNAHIP